MSSPIPLRSPRVIAVLMMFFPVLGSFWGCGPQPTEVPVASQELAPNPPESRFEAENDQPVSDPTISSLETNEADADIANANPTAVESTAADQPAENQSADKGASMTQSETTTEKEPNSGPLTASELEEEYVPDPEILAELEAQRQALRRLADTYDPPPGAKQLGKEADLWVDLKSKRVYVDGYVSMKRGPLEMLACPVGTKEHESVIALFAKSSDVHAALLAVGAKSGKTATWDPEFTPPTGQTVLVWIAYRDPKTLPKTESEPKPQVFVPDETFKVVDARKWIRRIETQDELAEPWVFSGSNFWTDPEDGTEYYSANSGDMICVSNFSTAMMDVPFASSADAGNILFEPFGERIPLRGTPVRLVLVPQPTAPKQPNEDESTPPSAASQPPTETILPFSK